MRRSTAGFTLIELMITVAIIGILAAVALPKYEQYLRRSQYVEITEAAMAGKSAIESCIQLKSDRGLCTQVNELTKHGFVASTAAASALVDSITVAAMGTDIAVTVTPANRPTGASFLTPADTFVLRAQIVERNAADLYIEQWTVDASSGCAPKQWC